MTSSEQYISQQVLPQRSVLPLPSHNLEIKPNSFENIPIELPEDVIHLMRSVSQIGLKDMYFGIKPDAHNRWEHAKGVYTHGMIWVTALHSDNRIPTILRRPPYPSLDQAQVLLGYSLLLHDYGHLFFSHLLDEVMHSINWIPAARGVEGLEYTVLKDRIDNDIQLQSCMQRSAVASGMSHRPVDIRDSVAHLINGWSGLTWLQPIVNGPIDADKIDYIKRDQEFLELIPYPVRTRLMFGGNEPRHNAWLQNFLSEQYVNHFGLLCLPGRSAVAAADLWRERLFLYDRFYLAPSIRAADRIAFEIIQQFLIRIVLSKQFIEVVSTDSTFAPSHSGFKQPTLSELIDEHQAEGPIDVVQMKYSLVTKILEALVKPFGNSMQLDWSCLSWMHNQLKIANTTGKYAYDEQYVEMIESSWTELEGVTKKQGSLPAFAANCIVGAPVLFPKSDLKTVQRIVRGFQHQHYRDVIIDVAKMPKVLSRPTIPGASELKESSTFCGLLVPKGPISEWNDASRSLAPLSDANVAELELPYGRLTVVSGSQVGTARKKYLFDRFIAALDSAGVQHQEVEP